MARAKKIGWVRLNTTVSPESDRVVRMLAAEQHKDLGIIVDNALRAYYAKDIERFAIVSPGMFPAATEIDGDDTY